MDLEEKLQKGFKEHEKEHSKYLEVIRELMPIFFDYSKKCSHKKTILALIAFQTHLSTLKNAIIDLSEDNNIYSMKALYRIYLENWLKEPYIGTRNPKEKMTMSVLNIIDWEGLGRS